MVDLLSRALGDRRNSPEADTVLDIDGRNVVLSASDVWNEMRPVEEAGRPHNVARDALRERLIQLVVERSNQASLRRGRPDVSPSDIRGNTEFANLLDRIWPTFSAQEFLRDLLASERRLKEHRWGLFEEDEVLRIARPPQARLPDEPWTAADLALMDEVDVLLNGQASVRTYQHVVVDEAQDLSPIQLRSIQRRRAKGITLLGDLAQATGAWANRSWGEVTAHLAAPDSAVVVELKIGYRVPAEVMAVANRIAESLDLPISVPEPVREAGKLPLFLKTEDERLVRSAIHAVREFLSSGLAVGLVVPDRRLSDVAAALRYEDLQYGDGRETTTKPITLLSAAASKGLEFDAVVVVEPMEISGNGDRGLNELFVALTRTTNSLSVVYAKPLPTQLAPWGEDSGPERAVEEPTPDTADTDASDLKTAGNGVRSTDTSELANEVLDSLVDSIANAVTSVLNPSSLDEFLSRLSERLRGTDSSA
jgi:DNA helicase IV